MNPTIETECSGASGGCLSVGHNIPPSRPNRLFPSDKVRTPDDGALPASIAGSSILFSRRRIGRKAGTLLVCVLCGAGQLSAGEPRTPQQRIQWNANGGYCGETALQTAGMFFGQYCPQYDIREIAARGVPQSSARSQLLLGVNDVRTAEAMRLDVESWRGAAGQKFWKWMRENLRAGHPVILGVFMNQNRFGESQSSAAGDEEYDHIVLVTGEKDGRFVFWDFGLWDGGGTAEGWFLLDPSTDLRPRERANSRDAPPYSLRDRGNLYALAVRGIAERNAATLPVRVESDKAGENPVMKEAAVTRPGPCLQELTVHVEVPENVGVNLYRYDSFSKVPADRHNARASQAAGIWKIPAGKTRGMILRVPVPSNETAIFRAVRESAP